MYIHVYIYVQQYIERDVIHTHTIYIYIYIYIVALLSHEQACLTTMPRSVAGRPKTSEACSCITCMALNTSYAMLVCIELTYVMLLCIM